MAETPNENQDPLQGPAAQEGGTQAADNDGETSPPAGGADGPKPADDPDTSAAPGEQVEGEPAEGPGEYDYGEGAEDYEDYFNEEYDYEQQEEWQGDQGQDEEREDVEEDEQEEDEEEEDEDGEDGQKKMTLVEHLDELRMRIIRALIGLVVGMALALIFGKQVFNFIQAPFKEVSGQENPFLALKFADGFLTYLKVCLYTGVVISAPWLFHQIWMFIAAGLHRHERRYVKIAVPFSAGLFVTGALFFMLVISRFLLGFFLTFNKWLNIETKLTLKDYVSDIVTLMLVFGFAFQMPIAVLILAKMGLVTTKTLGRYRKHVIVGILILAAVSTSPSPLDQVALAIPMWMLYELGILLAYFLVEKKQRQEELEDDEVEAAED